MLRRKEKYLFSKCEYILYSFKSFKTTAEIIVWGKSEKKEVSWRKNRGSMCGILPLFIILGRKVLGEIGGRGKSKENFLTTKELVIKALNLNY